MELKQWLNRGYMVEKKLKIKRAYLESLGNAISNYEPREIDHDNPENSAETIALRWCEAKREVDELKRRLLNIDKQVETELKKLDSDNEYTILFCRHILRMQWEDVAKATNYSKRHIIRIYNEGVEDLDRITFYQSWENDI